MGHLLSSAIKMQGAAAAPTLSYEVANYIQGTIRVYINGEIVYSLTSDTALTTVTLAAGDTIQMRLVGGDALITSFIYYYINGSLTNTYSGTTTITGGTLTSAAGNTYKFTYDGAA
jgi:hypothetical protein